MQKFCSLCQPMLKTAIKFNGILHHKKYSLQSEPMDYLNCGIILYPNQIFQASELIRYFFISIQAEILSLDFNKYEQQVVTSSVDKTIKIWDLRNLTVPINILQDHRYPVKKVRFSPHLGWLLGSGSYDMNVHFYDLRNPVEPLKFKHAQHTEFVSAIDFNLYD